MVVEITILWNPNAQGLETNGMDVYSFGAELPCSPRPAVPISSAVSRLRRRRPRAGVCPSR